MSRTLALTLVALCASASAFAGQSAATAAPSAQGRARAPIASTNAQRGTVTTPVAAAQAGTPAPAAPRIDTGLDFTDANITIEVTVTDKAAGGTATTTRVGTITVANQNSGSVRGLSPYFGNGNGQKPLDPAGLDIDAKTWLRKSGLVNTQLTVAYIPAGSEPVIGQAQRQSATLFLKPGQETVVLTTGSMTGSGPAVKITAKATVIK